MHKYDIEKIDKLNICINETITVTENIGVRYSLSLPFKNVTAGLTITIVLMNPSTANLIHSDGTVNKLINFFYNYKIDGLRVKKLNIGNIIPVYSSNPKDVALKLKTLNRMNMLKEIRCKNKKVLKKIIDESDKVILAWGKPGPKTIHNLFYYSQVNDFIYLTENIQKSFNVFKIENTKSILTENGDPRHVRGSVKISGLSSITIEELFGIK